MNTVSPTTKMYHRALFAMLIVSITMLSPSCAHKKHLTRTEKAAIAAVEQQRVQDSIAAADKALVQEQQRLQDSIAAAGAKDTIVQTMYIPRMTLTISMQGRQLTTMATVRWQRGTGAAVSIQPFAGIEMLRLELDAQTQTLTLIDKINRRYTRLTFDDLAQMGISMTMNEADAWMNENILAKTDEPQLVLQISRGGITGSAVIYTNSIQTNIDVNLRPTNVGSYKQVTLEQLIMEL